MPKVYNAFLVFHDWKDAFEALDGDSCKAILLAMFDYSENGNKPQEFSDPAARMAARFIFPAMERRAKDAENGRKGGNKRVENASAKTVVDKAVDNIVDNDVENSKNTGGTTPLEPPLNPPSTLNKTRQDKTRQDKTETKQDKTRQDEDKTNGTACADVSSVVGQALEICGDWLDVPSGISSKLTRMIRDYGYGDEHYRRLFEVANECAFLHGDGERGWKASLEWLVEHMDEVSAGKYRAWNSESSGSGSFDTEEIFEAALRRAHENMAAMNGGNNE